MRGEKLVECIFGHWVVLSIYDIGTASDKTYIKRFNVREKTSNILLLQWVTPFFYQWARLLSVLDRIDYMIGKRKDRNNDPNLSNPTW